MNESRRHQSTTTTAAPPLRLIAIKEVLMLTSLSRSSLYREISAGRFPIAVYLTKQRRAWVESEIISWMQSRADRRPQHPPGRGV